jgi:pimeloyl-ACP methyl ester carboxylesterase
MPSVATLPIPTPSRDTAAILAELGGYPCPDSDFTCVKLTVPADHFDPTNPDTIEVVFAVLPASGERLGMFVTATGGPGTSGLADADDYTAAFDPSIPEHFDIVFFDQRGIGASGGLWCIHAAAAYYQTDARTDTPEGEAALIEAARTFARDCVEEMGVPPDTLRYYSTRQAVEDLELFRQIIGDEKFWLYGESYGTQYAQTYAAAHPDRLAGLILDGAVDLTLSGPDYYVEQAQAFNDVLVMTLEACNADPACAAQAGGDALALYDDIAAELAASPQTYAFPLPDGGTDERTFTLGDLETAAAGYAYSEGGRMIFLRGLAAAARGDLTLLARIVYDQLSLDPVTLEPVLDPAWSDAAYYTVECNDYSFYSGSPEERAEAWMRAGDPVDASIPRLSSVFYGDLPCVFWPHGEDNIVRPEPLVAEGIPTIVLGSTADPATPLANGQRIFSRLADGYLIVTEGGPHVTFGWGRSCPDVLVTNFLVKGEPPAQREMTCSGQVIRNYVPLPPVDVSGYANVLDIFTAIDDDIYYLPEYYYWDLETPTTTSCPYGGGFTFEPSDEGELFTFTNCAFVDGFIMTGTGSLNYDTWLTTIEVTVSGAAEGSLTYTHADDGSRRVTGTYGGQTVDLSR